MDEIDRKFASRGMIISALAVRELPAINSTRQQELKNSMLAGVLNIGITVIPINTGT
jgi:hypothetical protein